MAKQKTQEECKIQFKKALGEFYETLESIDKDTPYSPSEPQWWLEMGNLISRINHIKVRL